MKMFRCLLALAMLCWLAAGGIAPRVFGQEISSPVVQGVSPLAGSVVGSLTQISVTFSEPVTNVMASDLLVNGVPGLFLLGSDSVYTFILEEAVGPGLVQVTWDPSHDIRDRSSSSNRFDENGPGATWIYTVFDGVPPTVTMIAPTAGV